MLASDHGLASMPRMRKKVKVPRFLLLLACALTIIHGTGCVSQISFNVGHEKLKKLDSTASGTVLLGQFQDTRSVTNAIQIGGRWEKADPVYVAGQKRPVADIVRDGFASALRHAGYSVADTGGNTVALDGEVYDFWLTDGWTGAICKIGVKVRLLKEGQTVWQTDLRAEEDDLVFIPNAMRAAFTTLLNDAAAEFSKPAFSEHVAAP